MAHPPRIPVWLPLEQDVIYFVTLCVKNRNPVLANSKTFEALQRTISKLENWHVFAVVLMPDHIHLLTTPSERDLAVGNFSGALKRWIRQELDADWQWQTGSFDRLLRKDESAQAKWEYMRENPVRAGLVKSWEDWPYSIGLVPRKL